MNKNFRDLLNERLKDEDFKKEYDELTPEYEVVKAFLNARKQSNMTQKELSEKSGVTVWECRNCGHIVVGTSAPELCPVCNHPQSYFEVHAENY